MTNNLKQIYILILSVTAINVTFFLIPSTQQRKKPLSDSKIESINVLLNTGPSYLLYYYF